jgi:AAA15 family ATPase/GTPase
MYITSLQIENYKSYRNSGEIPFTKGFNVIVGANNVGKTSMIEALTLVTGNNPHKSIQAKPYKSTGLNEDSIFSIKFQTYIDEFEEHLSNKNLLAIQTPNGRVAEPYSNKFLEAI